MHVVGEAQAVMREGSAACAVVLGVLARLAAHGELEVPIARTCPLERVREAFRELEQGHTHGKMVLRPQPPAARRRQPTPFSPQVWPPVSRLPAC